MINRYDVAAILTEIPCYYLKWLLLAEKKYFLEGISDRIHICQDAIAYNGAVP